MPKHLERSWLALNDAIGPYRQALADYLGCSVDSLDRMCSPPPGFSPETAGNRGTRNWLDDLHGLATRCPDGMQAIRWLLDQLGYDTISRHAPPEADQLPIVDPTLVLAAVERLAADCGGRRRRRLTEDQLLDLRDSLCDGLHALVASEIKRRRKGTK